jgi:nucleoside-diphosphate-sugar epimerase
VGTRSLLDVAVASGSRGFLYLSTSEVYGKAAAIPTSEVDFGPLDPTDPRASYAESKRAGEAMCVAWYAHAGVPARIVRPFHIYGPGMPLNDGRVFSDFVGDVVAGRSIVVKSAGTATRSYCYAADATAAFFNVLLDGEPATAYNVGDPNSEISVAELARLLVDLRPDKKLDVAMQARAGSDPYMPSLIERSAPEITRMLDLGWRPRTSLRDGFDRTIASFEND